MRIPLAVVFAASLFCAPLAAGAADHYACDCDTGAATGCVPGDDANDGLSPASPKKTIAAVRSAFAALSPGESVLLCRGGAFAAVAGRWNNSRCTAAQPCSLGDYTPSWAGGGSAPKPRIWVREEMNFFNLEDGGDAEHEEGYTFRNLDLRFTLATTDANAFFLYNDIDDVTIEGVDIDGFAIGVHQADSNPCNASDPRCDGKNSRLTIRGCRFTNNSAMGYLGNGDGLTLEDSYFENNGSRAVFDHNIYVGGEGNHVVVRRNELYRSDLQPDGSCAGVSLVVHGVHDDVLIENNLVREDVGKAGGGCWGITVDPGYGGEVESFRHVTIRGNVVRNVGNLGIGVASCTDCVIEDNEIIHEQAFGQVGIAAPDRNRGGEDLAMARVTVRNNSILFQREQQHRREPGRRGHRTRRGQQRGAADPGRQLLRGQPAGSEL
ncbi:MAG: right-handed parallel beta-helix repeat-containing protein [Myxococcales bacterium]